MEQNKLNSKDAILVTRQMIEAGFQKEETQQQLLCLGVSFAETHEIVENLYRHKENAKKNRKKGKSKKGFWRYAIGLVSVLG